MTAKHLKLLKITSLLLLSALLAVNSVYSETITSELLNIQAENNALNINVAKKYPEVHFQKINDENKILIELLDTKYHKNFKFNIPIKKNILSGLDFINDVSVGTSTYSTDRVKVVIILNTIPNADIGPKLISTKDSSLQISFLKDFDIQSNNKPETLKTLNQNEEIKNLYNIATEEYTKGNLDKAEEIYKEIISKDINLYIARYNLAKIYFDKQNYDEVLNVLTLLVEEIKSKNNGDENKRLLLLAKNILGSIYYLKEDYKTAEEQFKEILNIDPTFAEAYFNMGLIKEKNKEINDAVMHLKKAQELNSSMPEIYYHLGMLSLVSKNKKDATIQFKKVIELAAQDSKVFTLSKVELKKLE